jgi:hypothetical protein
MLNNLLDAKAFLVDIVDEMQGVVERHTMLINDMMPSFYEINLRIKEVDDVASSGKRVVMITGHPRAKFCRPAPIPAKTHTHRYGCRFPYMQVWVLVGPAGLYTLTAFYYG